MRKIMLIICIVLLLFGCKKTDHTPYSHWYVNNDSFSTNSVYVEDEHGTMRLGTNSFKNGFGIDVEDIALEGPLQISTFSPDPDHVHLIVYYNNAKYAPKNDVPHYISKTTVNKGLTQFTLETMWLFNINNFQDSVFTDSVYVHGVFNLPYSGY